MTSFCTSVLAHLVVVAVGSAAGHRRLAIPEAHNAVL